jgi:hypothetical protein
VPQALKEEVILKAADIKVLAQLAVLVLPVLALSYLVADTEKFKVSTLLSSPIITRFKKFRNPELYDAILPLLFTLLAITGFATGLFVVQTNIVTIRQLAFLLITLGSCGFIVIFQVFLSIAVRPLETIMAHYSKTSKRKVFSDGNIIFAVVFLSIIAALLYTIFDVIILTYQYIFYTTIEG